MPEGWMSTQHITIRGNGGDEIDAYYARPEGEGPFPSVVVIQHIFGVDEWIMEVCRRLAHRGYVALAPNLYARIGSLGSGPVEDLAARLRAKGGLNDDVVVGDLQAATDTLRGGAESNGKVGTIGFCMGGRFAYLAACRVSGLDAAVDCWGGGVAPDPAQPGNPPGKAPIEFTESMSAPLLGIFGNDDTRPDPSEVDRTEAMLKKFDKPYEFHRYDGAGHGFFNWAHISYRQQQAADGWEKVYGFFEKTLTR
ncbi:MAG TPA: dienelactone hydrolase family protein [Dehalococcoidia bacterium]|nr:dienelactone hydrolase family protein [Dehalococcoidia bacterium]